MPAPVLDGTATGISSSTTTVSATLTTTSTNDIICALIEIEQSTARWITGVSGGGLTWNKRTQATTFPTSSANQSHSLELWWAVAATALSSVTITATGNASWDDAAMLVFGVSGCNTTNPWDANASLAARNYLGAGSVTPTFSAISTTQANDFLIFGWGTNGNSGLGTVPTGFTSIGSRANGGGALNASVAAAYRAVTAAQSNQTFTWGSAISGSETAAIFDALTADSGGSTTAPRPTHETLTRKVAATTNIITIDTAGISANNVIVVLSYCEQSGGGPAISGISGGGLTWARRSRSHGSSRGSLDIWYAQVSGTLSNTTITVNYAATFDGLAIAVLSVAGCHTSVWDANSALPAMLSNTAGGTWTPSVSVSTSQAHDLVLAMTGAAANAAGVTSVPSAFQYLIAVHSSSGAQDAFAGIGSQGRATTQSGVTTTWGAAVADTSGAGAGGEYIIDVLTADAPPAVSTARQYAVSVI